MNRAAMSSCGSGAGVCAMDSVQASRQVRDEVLDRFEAD